MNLFMNHKNYKDMQIQVNTLYMILYHLVFTSLLFLQLFLPCKVFLYVDNHTLYNTHMLWGVVAYLPDKRHQKFSERSIPLLSSIHNSKVGEFLRIKEVKTEAH